MKHPRKIHGSFHTFGSSNPFPDAPNDRNTFNSVSDAKNAYKREARDSGHDYMLADGYGGGPACWMDLYDSTGWDGVSYGEPYARLEFTSDRMGIQTSSL